MVNYFNLVCIHCTSVQEVITVVLHAIMCPLQYHYYTTSSRDSREDREFCQAKTVKTRSNNLVVLAHVQLKPFYCPSTHDVTHVRKCTRPSPALPYCKRREAERGAWERGYHSPVIIAGSSG